MDRERTWRSEESTPTPQAMGAVVVSDLGGWWLRMLETLYASETSKVQKYPITMPPANSDDFSVAWEDFA